jgi:hypothetical protein
VTHEFHTHTKACALRQQQGSEAPAQRVPAQLRFADSGLLIAGVTFLCQSVPGQSGCFPKWNSEANTQSSEAVKSDSRFQA